MRLFRLISVLGCALWLGACNDDEVWQAQGPNSVDEDSSSNTPDTPQGVWATEVVTSGQRYTGMAVDSDGKTHISCYDGAGLIYAGGHPGDWHIQLVDKGAVQLGEGNDIAVGPDKVPQISYRASQTEVRLARLNGTNWNIMTVGTGDRLGSHTAIAVDGLNRPHVVYYDEHLRYIRYATLSGGVWTRESVAELENWEQHVDIAVDGSGVPHVAFLGYSDGQWSVKYATRTSEGWQSSPVNRNGSFAHPSIAVRADGTPHVAYQSTADSDGNQTLDLMYSVWTAAGWEASLIDGLGNVGDYNSIVLDSSGSPRISYVDSSNHALKFARLRDGAWTNEVVDANSPSRGVAWQTAVALDSQGRPHISYFDSFNDRLMYTHK